MTATATVEGRSGPPAEAIAAGEGDVLALPVGERGDVDVASSATLASAYGVDLADVVRTEGVRGRPGEVVRVPVQTPAGRPARLLLVGVGVGAPVDLRRAGAALARAVKGRTHLLTTVGAGSDAPGTRALVEGLLLAGHVPDATGLRSRTDSAPVPRIDLLGPRDGAAVARGLDHARATLRARDLAEMPASTKNPEWVVQQAREVGRQFDLDITVWDEEDLLREGFGGLVAVGKGSATPPRLVRLDYPGTSAAAARAERIVLVGKGITYDTGGISIKPREAMVPMKTDMTGSAVVLSVIAACRAAGVRRPVTVLLPLAENAFGAASYRPSDVVTIHGGRTVEVTNTDAEGRMVLADALAYADAELDPEIMVDVATLTGAATLGLGRRHAALFATDDPLAEALTAAGEAAGERAWRLPLAEDYRSSLDSTVADVRHVPAGSIGGGAITAALFLREFTGGRRWAHLDIAGPARSDKDEHEVTRGATGFGARLLLRWLEGLR